MKAELYICNGTFAYNGKDSVEDVRRKLSDFQILMDKIRKYHDENVLYIVKEEFGNCVLFDDGKNIMEFISDYHNTVNTYGKDIYTLFLSILKHCQNTTLTLNDMKEFLTMDDEQSCSAILVLNPLDGYDEHVQVLSNVNGWLKFRRHFLAKYPQNEDFFIKESKKYFPSLCIHEHTKTTISDVLNSHPQRIIAYLTVLNDFLITEFKDNGGNDLNVFLPWFASKHHLDGASFEGGKDDKFKFTFPNGIEAYCEPHLKMYKDDVGNYNQHCRIYFKKPQEGEIKVYVGCICRHL